MHNYECKMNVNYGSWFIFTKLEDDMQMYPTNTFNISGGRIYVLKKTNDTLINAYIYNQGLPSRNLQFLIDKFLGLKNL